MAKLFYSIEEAAQKLGKSEDEVRSMAQRGEITEFRDGDRLIFKKDQIDLLSGDEGDEADLSGMIPLSDSSAGTGMGSGLGLADSGSGDLSETRPDSSSVKTGISIFDDDTEEEDPSAQTQVTSGGLDPSSLDSFGGGGSGMMDFTREDDSGGIAADSMLGELYSGGSVAGGPGGGGSGLFEGQAASGGGLGAAPAASGGGVALAEAYDGRGSWMAAGIGVAMLATLLGAIAVIMMGMIGTVPDFLRTTFDGNMMIWMGIAAGVLVIFGGLGFALGGRGE